MTLPKETSPPLLFPYARPEITKEDQEAVLEALSTPCITRGNQTRALEEELQELLQVPHALVFSSGSAALWCACKAVRMATKEKCARAQSYVPNNTFAATASAALYAGMQLELLDVDATHGRLTPKQLQVNVPERIETAQLLLPVHYGAQTIDMKALQDASKVPHLYVIEDAAQALGSKDHEGNWVGSCHYSDMTILSLHAIKNITAGEGGVVTTRSSKLYELLKIVRNSGLVHSAMEGGLTVPQVVELSCNFHLSEMQAALARSQLRRLKAKIAHKTALYQRYEELFAQEQKVHLEPLQPGALPCIAPLRLGVDAYFTQELSEEKLQGEQELDAARLLRKLEKIQKSKALLRRDLRRAGIATAVHYVPLSHHPLFQQGRVKEQLRSNKNRELCGEDLHLVDHLLESECFYQRSLSLPFYDDLELDEAEKIAHEVLRLVKKHF